MITRLNTAIQALGIADVADFSLESPEPGSLEFLGFTERIFDFAPFRNASWRNQRYHYLTSAPMLVSTGYVAQATQLGHYPSSGITIDSERTIAAWTCKTFTKGDEP